MLSNRFVLLGIITFVCSIGLFLRQSLFALDSYSFKAFVCTGWNAGVQGNPLALYFFELMPCNLLFFKIVMFLSLLISLYFVFLIVRKEFCEKTAWQSIVLLLALSPLLLFEFGKFENELLAYPFIVFSIYCFLNSKWFESLAGLTASLVFWGWPYYLVINVWASGVLESRFLGGMLPLFGLVFVLPFVFLSKNKKILFGATISIVLFLFNMKFFIFLMPFLGLGIGYVLDFVKDKQQVKNFLWVLAIILIVSFNVAFFFAQPTFEEHKLSLEAVTFAKDNNLELYNDWSVGYLILDKGLDTGIYGGGPDTNYYLYEKPFVALTNQDLSELACVPISNFSSSTRSLTLWECK